MQWEESEECTKISKRIKIFYCKLRWQMMVEFLEVCSWMVSQQSGTPLRNLSWLCSQTKRMKRDHHVLRNSNSDLDYHYDKNLKRIILGFTD